MNRPAIHFRHLAKKISQTSQLARGIPMNLTFQLNSIKRTPAAYQNSPHNFQRYYSVTSSPPPTMSTNKTKEQLAHIKDEAIIFAPKADQYGKTMLDRTELINDPAEQFHKWFDDAVKANISIPEAVTFSTAQLPSGKVSSRIVLMKELDKNGDFVIYSNWGSSKKAKDIETNKYVSLTFFWKELERQVRVEGTCERLTTEESQVYFDTRPRKSRIGAWASPQSESIHRHDLDKRVEELEKKFEGQEQIPCPPHWGGLRITPSEFEFFQGRPNRVHDRFVFLRQADQSWAIDRVAP